MLCKTCVIYLININENFLFTDHTDMPLNQKENKQTNKQNTKQQQQQLQISLHGHIATVSFKTHTKAK